MYPHSGNHGNRPSLRRDPCTNVSYRSLMKLCKTKIAYQGSAIRSDRFLYSLQHNIGIPFRRVLHYNSGLTRSFIARTIYAQSSCCQ